MVTPDEWDANEKARISRIDCLCKPMPAFSLASLGTLMDLEEYTKRAVISRPFDEA